MKINKSQLKEIIKEELNEMEGIMGRGPGGPRPGDIVHVQDILDQLAKALTGDPALRAAQKDFIRALNDAGWDVHPGDERHREAVPPGLKYVGQGEPMLEKATGESVK